MIDIHMHTIYSDGDKTVEEVLKMCEERKLEYISITDHDTCKQYDDKSLKNNKIFSGKIIKGTELHAVFQNKNIEILAYNIKPNIINEWCEKYYSEDKLKKQQEICRNRLFDICDKHGLIYDKNRIRKPKKASEYVERPIYEEVMTHKENHKILGEFTESFGIFFRKGLANPESSYFMNHIEFRPKYKEVIDIIHKAYSKREIENRLLKADLIYLVGGKQFEYSKLFNETDTVELIKNVAKQKVIMGTSAGAIVLGTQIQSKEFWNNRYNIDFEDIKYSELNLVPFNIIPHYLRDDHKQWTRDFLNETLANNPFPVYAIKDTQAIAYIDGKIEYIGGKPDIFGKIV